MTAADEEVTLSSLAHQLTGLADLFRRRLLDDRTKQVTIDDLKIRLERAEQALAVEALRPLVIRLAMLIERLQSAPIANDLRLSIIEELQDVLQLFGVTVIGADDTIDPRRHQIVSVTGEGAGLRVGRLVQSGYEKDGIVLRPAKVTAVRVTLDSGAKTGSDD